MAPNLNILFSDVYAIVNAIFFLPKHPKEKLKNKTNKQNPQNCLDFSFWML